MCIALKNRKIIYMQRGKKPYTKLGQRLSSLRQKLNETIPDVSGAVELDNDIIASYENGERRPSEDVLEMLISHFDIKGEEADELWELAGYNNDLADTDADSIPTFSTAVHPMPTVVVVPVENKIIYTDKANVTVNTQGVVLSFMQEAVTPGQPATVSRLGMSADQAKKVADTIYRTLEQFEDHRSKESSKDKEK